MEKEVKITIIDDDRDLVEFVKTYLQRRGFLVSFAYSGGEGLEVVRKERPQLIILDIMMPEMDGSQVLRELKKDSTLKDIPVIMLTAKDRQIDRTSFLELGAYEYIAKPLDMDMLLRQVRNVLEKKEKGEL